MEHGSNSHESVEQESNSGEQESNSAEQEISSQNTEPESNSQSIEQEPKEETIDTAKYYQTRKGKFTLAYILVLLLLISASVLMPVMSTRLLGYESDFIMQYAFTGPQS